MQQIIVAFLIVSLLANNILAENRTVSVQINPFCNEKCQHDLNSSSANLVWIKLEGHEDTIHYLYSTIDSFTFMIFRTNITSKLQIKWNELLNKTKRYQSISFDPAPLDLAGYSIPYIYEFKDENGIANMTRIPNNQSYWKIYKTSNLLWDQFRPLSNTSGLFEAREANSQNGSFKFVIKYPGEDNKRDDVLPHLLLNAGSNSIDFIIDEVQSNFNLSKFAVNFVLINAEQMDASLTKKQTLDDEFTPGTFHLWNVEINEQNNNTRINNYIEWKPIFYYYYPRILENSTITLQYDLKQNQTLPDGLANVFSKELFAYGFNVSFGLEGNYNNGHFYSKYNYSAWTFAIGLSRAPVEKMSSIVSLVIAIGFGLPAFVVVVGLFGMMVKKLKRNQYSQI